MKKLFISKRRIASLITPVVFLALIFSFAVVNTLKPDKAYSESENRKLEQRPKFTLEALFDGSYIAKVEKYVTDQFVARDTFVGAKTQTDFILGKRDTNNIYFGEDNYLFELYSQQSVNKEQLNKNLNFIKEFITAQNQSLGSDKMSVMLVPSASVILKDKLPPLAPTFSQSEVYEKLGSELAGNYIDVISALEKHKDEEVYYKTDHHWTTLGAYYAYRAFCEQKGIAGYTLEDFTKKAVSDNFFGTLYNKARLITTSPDSINIYEPRFESSYQVDYNMGQKQANTLYDESYLEKRDQYSYFLSSNNAVVTIKSQNENGKTLLLLKDSFSHSLAPFLANDYENVILVDLRYYNGSIKSFIGENNVTDVLAIYHFSTLESDTNMVKIKG